MTYRKLELDRIIIQGGVDWINRTAQQRGNNPIEVAAYLLQRISGHKKHKKANELAKKLFETMEIGMEKVPVVYACWLICMGHGLGKSAYR